MEKKANATLRDNRIYIFHFSQANTVKTSHILIFNFNVIHKLNRFSCDYLLQWTGCLVKRWVAIG